MSKIKKVLAVFLTLAMVLGMGMTTFAEDETPTPVVPSKSDVFKATASNIEDNASVIAYQVVKADYNEKGFYGYSAVLEGTIANPMAPTSDEITALAKKYGDLTTKVEMKDKVAQDNELYSYSADLNAGYWMVLVKGTKEVYNPMLIGVYYTVSGSDNTMATEIVDANTNWDLKGTDAYAKSSEIPITKTAKDTANLGEEVEFTIKTTVPDYSAEYDKVTFNVKDTLTGLAAPTNIEVTADKTITNKDYSINPGTTEEKLPTFTVVFTSEWIKANGGANITITYKAAVIGGDVNQDPHSNKAEVIYTNNPGEDNGHNQDIEKVYTFDIDGDVTADILKKVAPGKNQGETVALKDAEFTLYTDVGCKNQYTNTKYKVGEPTSKSDDNGKIYITGLDAGTYYLKETKAPSGYTLNDTVYQIDIAANVVNEELTDWSIKITDLKENKDVTNNFTVKGDTASAGSTNATTNIMNTTIKNLPSTGGIGTTIFTIGGCLIMIIAAALFFASRRKEHK